MTEYDSENIRKPLTHYFADAEKVTASTEFFSALIDSITDEDIKSISYEDILECHTSMGEAVGNYHCKIDRCSTMYGGNNLISVSAHSEGSVGEMRFANILEAEVTQKLETITQNLTEALTFKDRTCYKRSTLSKTDDGFEIQKEIMENGQVQHVHYMYSQKCLENFISEGANLILQRLMIKKGFQIPFETVGLDAEGFPSVVEYTDLGDRTLLVDSEEINLRGIERIINSYSPIPLSWQTYFTDDGHLALKIQTGSPITMKVTKVPGRHMNAQYLETPVIPREPLLWRDDMELFSKFMDRKEEIKADYMLYLRNHPEVNEILSDFVQALLMNKPKNTIQFAQEFFKSFSAYGLPTNLFLRSDS